MANGEVSFKQETPIPPMFCKLPNFRARKHHIMGHKTTPTLSVAHPGEGYVCIHIVTLETWNEWKP